MSDDDRFLAVELRLKICEARLRRGAEATISALNGGAEGKQGERGPRGLLETSGRCRGISGTERSFGSSKARLAMTGALTST